MNFGINNDNIFLDGFIIILAEILYIRKEFGFIMVFTEFLGILIIIDYI